jgi:hypothetical protein
VKCIGIPCGQVDMLAIVCGVGVNGWVAPTDEYLVSIRLRLVSFDANSSSSGK